MNRRLGRYLLWPLLVLVTACGFHLRGSDEQFAGLPAIYIEGDDIALIDLLRQTLQDAGAVVVEQPAATSLHLLIRSESLERRVLSVNSSGKVQEYILFYQLRFILGSAANDPEQAIELQRDFDFSGTDVLAKEDEAASLFRQMRREAARRLLRRLQAQLKNTSR